MPIQTANTSKNPQAGLLGILPNPPASARIRPSTESVRIWKHNPSKYPSSYSKSSYYCHLVMLCAVSARCFAKQLKTTASMKRKKGYEMLDEEDDIERGDGGSGGGGGGGSGGGRGLHLSTLQVNLSAFCVTGDGVRGCFGGV